MTEVMYQYTLPGGAHWSFKIRRGMQLKLIDMEGGANLGMLMFNPENLLEKYNAPDTLKCQHTFKLHRGHCLYTDMGRVICSITEDSFGWHDTVCGLSNAQHISKQWGERNYQTQRNEWHQNGFDAFLVELAKYGLTAKDIAANVNWFSKTLVDGNGNLSLEENNSEAGNSVTLRFEMDALVLVHSCPHPLKQAESYPYKPVKFEFDKAPAVSEDDYCMNYCEENQRGFHNNSLYYMGAE